MKFNFEINGFPGKHPFLSKTLIFNALAILAEILTLDQFGELVPAEYRGYIGVASGIVNFILRSRTQERIDWSQAVETLKPLLKPLTPKK